MQANSEDYRNSHLEKGADYHSTFYDNPYRSYMWSQEQQRLEEVAKNYCPGNASHLDFACGTGRILAALGDFVGDQTGVDVSESMLSEAKKNAMDANFHCADLTANDVLDGREFDLISAFRFFPNAQHELRREVMLLLAGKLSSSGVIVFNNHNNPGSSARRIAALLGNGSDAGMRAGAVDQLVAECGLTVVRTYVLGVFPNTENRMLLPRRATRLVDATLGAMKVLDSLAQNTIYVCTRK